MQWDEKILLEIGVGRYLRCRAIEIWGNMIARHLLALLCSADLQNVNGASDVSELEGKRSGMDEWMNRME